MFSTAHGHVRVISFILCVYDIPAVNSQDISYKAPAHGHVYMILFTLCADDIIAINGTIALVRFCRRRQGVVAGP